jgi:hypothetical protein
MPVASGKLRVLIPTTTGPVEVLLLTEEDAAIGRCVACIGGTTETADIAAAYHAFVVRPTGLIESRFGHSCYRLDVSGRIDAGSSWQLAVLLAHALHAAGRLAEENDQAEGVLWATGSVRAVDLTVGGVSHVPEKLASSLDRLRQEAGAGRRVLLAVPAQNADELAPIKGELAAHGIEAIAVTHVDALFGALSMKLPEKTQGGAIGAPKARRALRTRTLWGAAAAILLAVVSGALVLGNWPHALTAGAPPGPADPPVNGSPNPAATERSQLVPELVPFISAHEQTLIRDEYVPAPGYKAVATSLVYMSFVTGQSSQKAADDAAVEACDQRNNVSRLNAGLNPTQACEVYASGEIVVTRRPRPPMPPAPWVIRNPSVERPFVANDLPLLSEEYRQQAAKNYLRFARSKAFVVSPTGSRMAYYGEPSPEEAMRRALERCGFDSGHACMVVAIDDTFVVPIPTLARAIGFYRPDALTSMQLGVRDDVARRLANVTNGWNAVAVGASGQAGVKVGSGSEQTAVDGALEDCAKHDRDCRIAVIGPFLVEP